MFDVKSDKFWVILFSEVGGRTDEMTGLADAGRFEVRGSPVYRGQVHVRTLARPLG